jgi:hypothetical protein
VKIKLHLFPLFFLLIGACTPSAQPEIAAPPAQASITAEATTVVPVDTSTPELTATTLPQTEESATQAVSPSGTECASADAVMLGQSIADDFAFTSVEEVLTWFCAGAEFEDILVALQTEELSGVPAEEMLAMLADGLSWDDIWQTIGLTNE